MPFDYIYLDVYNICDRFFKIYDISYYSYMNPYIEW